LKVETHDPATARNRKYTKREGEIPSTIMYMIFVEEAIACYYYAFTKLRRKICGYGYDL
jgi:hypothetical protein